MSHKTDSAGRPNSSPTRKTVAAGDPRPTRSGKYAGWPIEQEIFDHLRGDPAGGDILHAAMVAMSGGFIAPVVAEAAGGPSGPRRPPTAARWPPGASPAPSRPAATATSSNCRRDVHPGSRLSL